MKDFGFINDKKHKVTYMANNKQEIHKWYSVWTGMIHRCYNPNNINYKDYGAKGVWVEDYFKLASQFRDWYLLKNPTGLLTMDKDKKGINYYGVESIVFVTKSDNSIEAMSRRNYNSFKGINHPKSKPLEYYATKASTRSSFKNYICLRQGWNFDDFEEIYSGEKCSNNKKFYYKSKK